MNKSADICTFTKRVNTEVCLCFVPGSNVYHSTNYPIRMIYFSSATQIACNHCPIHFTERVCNGLILVMSSLYFGW